MVIAVQFTVYGLMGPVAAIIIRAWGHAVATYIGKKQVKKQNIYILYYNTQFAIYYDS